MRNKIIAMVLILLALNCISFVVARIIATIRGDTAAELHSVTKPGYGGTLTYLVAGTFNQAKTAYDFLEPELMDRVTYLQFRLIGWSAKATAEKIAADVKAQGADQATKVLVYTISVGDHVGRYLEEMLDGICELWVIPINPCSDIKTVIQPFRFLLITLSPLLELGCHVLGWLSALPVIPAFGEDNWYSLVLLADQYWVVTYDRPKRITKHSIGLICSQPDEYDSDGLLDNRMIRAYFRRRRSANVKFRLVTIKTGHSDTVNYAGKYLYAVRQILLNKAQ